jgi:glycine/D-amino acid oxidase-like deaminating enzyme/nitrite reductase/ring-hydroxylating ferredoxin subunit
MARTLDIPVSRHDSVWSASFQTPLYPPLEKDLRADVVVVGAGIAGISVAYTLMREGLAVVVLDDGPIGGGITRLTTAHVACAMDFGYSEIASLHGEAGAALAAQSHTAAIDRVERNAREEEIDCDFERLDGFLFLARGQERSTIEEEFKAARAAGLPVELLKAPPLDTLDPGPAIRFPNQGRFHPLKYITGLAHAIERAGGRLFGGTHVTEVSGGKDAHVKAGQYTVSAKAVVVATNSPINDRIAIHTKQAPYTTYVLGAAIPRGSVPPMLLWDNDDPYHYVRAHPFEDGEILIIGGEDHKSGQADDSDRRHGRLERWARIRFPMIERIAFHWSGQVMESMDGLAFIGRNPGSPENVYVVTGDTGMGMTHGTIAGILIPDLIQGRANSWADLYDPSRKSFKAAGTFAKENLNVAAQYVDWVTPGDAAEVDELDIDSGAVIRQGIRKIAVYRDTWGKVHTMSAVCPHLGCIVQWNVTAKTWDCPCHGSRFDKRGQVINGPANTSLRALDAPRKTGDE